jgi:RNA polymerase sigma factor (sigma-70 family)
VVVAVAAASASASVAPRADLRAVDAAPISTDLVRSYLRDIGRVPLLSHEQEITLGRQVQDLVALEELEQELAMRAGGSKPDPEQLAEAAGLTPQQLRKRLRSGQRAKERMVAANLRLVVSVAKKYTKRNMELLDLIQEGTIGLVRGVEKFDPEEEVKDLLCRARQPVSLETKVGDGDDTELLDLLASDGSQPEELVDGECLRGDMRALLEQLPDLQGRVLKMRYGIGFDEPMSLSSIARELEMSRDRARSLERRAHEELRRLSRELVGYLVA